MAKKTISADHQRGPTRDRPRRNVLASNLVEAWSGPIFIGISFLALILWSWRKWPDPLIDFGRELYVPWRLAEGDILYRNITTPYGPLSPYLNAAFFKLFGTSFTTLIICNLAILAGLTILIYRLFKQLFYFGEQIMLQSLKASKPELIVLIHRDTTEFGFGHFGADLQYGKQILDWIHSDYAQIELLGAEPFQDRRFGIKILRRRPNG